MFIAQIPVFDGKIGANGAPNSKYLHSYFIVFLIFIYFGLIYTLSLFRAALSPSLPGRAEKQFVNDWRNSYICKVKR